MDPLTPQRAAVLAYLKAQALRGHAPSLAEIAAEFGFASRNAAHKHVQALAEAGLIQLRAGQKRGIRLPEAVRRDALLALPVLGRVAAGVPIGADIGLDEQLLLDAGVELDSLFTADVTRTLPINGTFTETQRRIYDAVYAAQEAGIAAVKPGNKFGDVHAAAIRVIAEHLHSWGLLPEGVSVEDSLKPEGQYHRRWMVHGTSHHLGIDVHDCALARREEYLGAELLPGMCLTVEPGLYFKADDLKVPEEFRGIGVRIEDDVLVTEDGCENLSGFMPRTADDVEAWMARLRG